MKKIVALLIMSLLVGLAFASLEDFALESYQSAFSICKNNDQGLEIDFSLPEFEILEEAVSGQLFHRIFMPNTGTLMDTGMPELPVISTSIAIPHQGSVNIEVLNSQYSILTDFNAYPLQQGQELESPKGLMMNSQFYLGNQSYPQSVVAYSDPMILRDFRIITLQVNPFNFNPATGELSAFDHLKLKVNFTNAPGLNELAEPVSYISPSFDKIYQSYILNYEDFRYMLVQNTPPRYLIIHGNTTDNVFLTALNDFVLWKRQKGAEVNVASTASNQAGASTTAIQTYIRNQYNNPNTRPDFVILIGDTTGSYTIPCFTNNGGASDYPYSHMNTGDLLGDLFVGRISVENITQFKTVLRKIYLYERDININTAAWLNRVLLIGDTYSGISTKYISKYIKEMAAEANPAYTFVEQYANGFNGMVSTINGAFNQGIAFYSFRGWIDYAPPAESALSNGFKLPHVIAITCGSGNFNSLAESEQIIRYGTEANPKGAVSAIGMATSSTHTSFNNAVHGGIFEGIFALKMRSIGEALLHGKLHINQIYGVSSAVNVEKFSHWCNLMGDPSMEVFVGIPNTFTVSVADSIPIGLSLLDVDVIDAEGIAVENACVTLSLGPTILCRGYTDSEGKLILQLPEVIAEGTAVLTVSTQNFKPLQKDIEVLNWATLVPAAMLIDDDNYGASEGNDNGIATAGETLEVFFGLLNTGADTISGVSGIATSESPWIEFIQNEVNYPTIMGGATGNNLTPIVLKVHPATPHRALLRLDMQLTDSEGNAYTVSEFIRAEAADIHFVNLSITDSGNNNQLLEPGESAILNISVINNGAAVVTDVYARLYTENDLISITDHIAYIGTLSLGTISHTSPDNNFQVWLREETLVGMVMPLYVRLYNDNGFEQFVHFSLTVGNVSSTDPLGPDTYGYVIYDWTDTSYSECPVYDWYEIAPSLGGQGTPLPISDVHNANNEGDQTGAQSLAVVNLPFPFQFYGRIYDQITVCSNGFIAMGVSENAEFRNYRLPGAMGPSPMIAPFWDDLATHSGSGIYTLFDRSNHAFIVEWYNMRNGYNGSSPETFQVILYDQSVHETSLGDGPIKFQYHTFNNVNVHSGNRHGSYSSIGIEDHTGTRGLEYTYNNQYPTAAAPLSNGKALYITNVPVYYEAANVMIDEIHLADDNSVVEPGETVNFGISLQNSGNVTANNLSATISSADPFVNIINGESAYFDIEPENSGVNRNPFTVAIAPDCPSEHTVSFLIEISTPDQIWERAFSLRVESNQLQYHSLMISDYEGNFNGVIEPGETVTLILNVKNNSVVDAHDVNVQLSTDVPNLNILNPAYTIDKIGANQIMQARFELDFGAMDAESDYLSLYFRANPLNGEELNINFHIPYNLPNLSNNFELDNGGFSPETGWTWGTPTNTTAFSGNKVWATNLSGHYPNNIMYHLFSPKYTLAENSQLSFMHYYGLEDGFDGANVAISTNNGQSWQLLTPLGGYTHDNIAVLSNQPGYSGMSGAWLEANFDLAQYANQEVSFRFRLASNGDITSIGWLIDDFELSGVNLKVGHLSGTIYPSSGYNPNTATVRSNQHYSTTVKSDGSFRLYLPNGTHSITAKMPNHQSSTLNNVLINPANPVATAEFTLINMPPVENLSYYLDEENGLLQLLWDEPDPFQVIFPVNGYRVYRMFNSGPFELVQEAPELSYTEHLELHGLYQYYVCPMFSGEEGSPSEIMIVPFFMDENPEDEVPLLITKLNGNYPNPFNPTTNISFSLAKAGKARLDIYNTKGQLVRSLANGDYSAGQHHLVWNGRDDSGRSVATGLYFYRLDTADYSKTRKMILMK